ncbi:hypothetical protein MKQ70_36695 [Chitinophaga sedimenti]|uniref:hypothetical protein n=1 Tax=Chitinophaga sedimenti TaxID=2033606 RepID=UPI0020057204|nr:hypothetical protein [Chitinophaga sedimenti]MCK7560162.1 hypothetical protein [Chitinophaga sedimenti]
MQENGLFDDKERFGYVFYFKQRGAVGLEEFNLVFLFGCFRQFDVDVAVGSGIYIVGRLPGNNRLLFSPAAGLPVFVIACISVADSFVLALMVLSSTARIVLVYRKRPVVKVTSRR